MQLNLLAKLNRNRKNPVSLDEIYTSIQNNIAIILSELYMEYDIDMRIEVCSERICRYEPRLHNTQIVIQFIKPEFFRFFQLTVTGDFSYLDTVQKFSYILQKEVF